MGGHGSLRERLGRVFSIGRVTLVSFGQPSQVVALYLRIRVRDNRRRLDGGKGRGN